jgi:hypothetical protein
VTVWDKDPMFESKSAETSLPFVSSTAHSRLVITAVLTKGRYIKIGDPMWLGGKVIE